MVDEFFTTHPTLELLNLKGNVAYPDYPHAWIGLPREAEVERVVRDSVVKDAEGVVRHFLSLKKGKMGVREKIEEIMARKTVTDENGKLAWI